MDRGGRTIWPNVSSWVPPVAGAQEPVPSTDDDRESFEYGKAASPVILDPDALKNLWVVLGKHFSAPPDSSEVKFKRRIKGRGFPPERTRYESTEIDEFIDSGDLKGLLDHTEVSFELRFKTPDSPNGERRAVTLEMDSDGLPEVDYSGDRNWRLAVEADLAKFFAQHPNTASRKRAAIALSVFVVISAALLHDGIVGVSIPTWLAVIILLGFFAGIPAFFVWLFTARTFYTCRVYTDRETGKEPVWYKWATQLSVIIALGVVSGLIVLALA